MKHYLLTLYLRKYIIKIVKGDIPRLIAGAGRREEDTMEEMTRLELLTLLYSIQALMETGNTEKAKEIIEKVIKEAERQQ